jgi:TctA family transporter
LSAGIGGAALAYHMGNEETSTKYYIRNIRRINLGESIIPLITYYATGTLVSGAVTLIEATRNPDQGPYSLIPIFAAGLVSVASAVLGGLYLSRNDNKPNNTPQ